MPEEARAYLVARIFGWPPSVQDEQPAHVIDWMLAIHGEMSGGNE